MRKPGSGRVRPLVLLLLVALTACGPRQCTDETAERSTRTVPDRLTLTAVPFAELPGWADDDQSQALAAFIRSCPRLTVQPGDWQAPCAAAATVSANDPAAARAFFEAWFTPMAAGNNDEPKGLFTGYYEPMLNGARSPDSRFTEPLYARPADLVMVDLGEFAEKLKGERIAGRVVEGRLRPYEDRAGIVAGALKGRVRELLWLDDPVGVFFLHVQGSGRVRLPDGSEVRVGYDGQNGHKYVAIGRELVQRGALTQDNVSMQSIRAWLKAHPEAAQELMNRNPSYVFFRELREEGPVGAQGVPLTPGRSLAVDRGFITLGAPVWLDAEDPLDKSRRLRRLMVAQDTGGAIRGPVRGDVFWGHGPEAEERAGRMRSVGRYYVLLPKKPSA